MSKPTVSLAHAALTIITALSTLSACAKSAELIDNPITSQLQEGIASGQSSFAHDDFSALLATHVKEDQGRVDYAGLKAEQAKLNTYLERVATAKLNTLSEPQSKALLINAYNAYTLQLMLEHYPNIKSIKELSNPWGTKRYKVGQQTLSLDDIEHGLLRPLYKDPRIHFAVNCASVGCPPLAASAFEGDTLDAQLDAAAKRTLTNPRYAKREGDKLKLTSILNWYGADFTNPNFTGHAKSVPAYVAPYTTPELKAFIDGKDGEPAVSFFDYDWSINDITR